MSRHKRWSGQRPAPQHDGASIASSGGRGRSIISVPAENAAGESAAKGAGEVHARVLAEAVDFFRVSFSAEWEMLRLCPLQHGIETMARMLAIGR